MTDLLEELRQLLVSCRSVMETARADYDPASPAHSVLSYRIAELGVAIGKIDAAAAGGQP